MNNVLRVYIYHTPHTIICTLPFSETEKLLLWFSLLNFRVRSDNGDLGRHWWRRRCLLQATATSLLHFHGNLGIFRHFLDLQHLHKPPFSGIFFYSDAFSESSLVSCSNLAFRGYFDHEFDLCLFLLLFFYKCSTFFVFSLMWYLSE